jgi:hypothetical protein
VHLDPRPCFVEEGDVAPLLRLEVGTDRGVEMTQRVEVDASASPAAKLPMLEPG